MTPARVEQVVFAVSAAIVLGVVGAAVGLDLATPKSPHPEIVARLDGAPWDDAGARAVPWVVENVGTWDVEDVALTVQLGAAPGVTQGVDYLPRGATRHGVARVPAGEGDPVLTVVGYGLP